MSVTSGFFNSLNGDRRYTAEQFSELMDGLINDGVFANIGSAFAVNAATGNGITIGIGRAWFNGTWLYNDAVLPMNVRAAEALVDRIDALVIEINRSDAVRAGNIMFVYGEPSSTPVRPSLTNTDEIHQYPLAYIYRSAGATSVSQADIENMVGTSACPFVTGILEVVDVDQLLTQWNTQFGNWFDNLQITLSGDVAANLANQILELQSQFDTLAKEKAVYSVLFDSSGEAIRDNNNGEIMGKTVVGGDGNSTANIEGDAYQIGDTLTTARTDLGEEWLLCNGETISEGQYPYLFPLLSSNLLNRTIEELDDISETISSGCLGTLVYINGYYITYTYGSTAVKYCTDLKNGTWSTVSNSGGISVVTNVQWVNGYWIISGNNGSGAYFSYSENLNGSWTPVSVTNLMSRGGVDTCYGVWFIDGYWITHISVSLDTLTYVNVGYATTINATYKSIISDDSDSDNPRFIPKIVRSVNGYLEFRGNNYRVSRIDMRRITQGTTSYVFESAYAFYPDSDTEVNGVMEISDEIVYLINYMFFHSSSNAEVATAGIYANGSYNEILRITAGNAQAKLTDVFYIDPYYIVCGVYYVDNAITSYRYSTILAFSINLDGPWTVKVINEYDGVYEIYNRLAVQATQIGSTPAVLQRGTTSNYNIDNAFIFSEDKVDLPAISRELYTYIKAQE